MLHTGYSRKNNPIQPWGSVDNCERDGHIFITCQGLRIILLSRSIQATGSNTPLTQKFMYNLKLTGKNKRPTKPAFIFKRSKLSKFNTCFEETRRLKYICNMTISK